MLSFTLENCYVEKKINSKIDANILNLFTIMYVFECDSLHSKKIKK